MATKVKPVMIDPAGASEGDVIKLVSGEFQAAPENVPSEEQIVGKAIYDAAVTGTYNLDLANFASFYGILTGNTVLTVSNTPASEKTFVRSLTIKSTTTESLTLPVSWNQIGEFVADGSEYDFEIKFSNFPTVGLKVNVYINKVM